MFAKLPSEIQEEIIKYILPVKSLIRFRSVSKQWKSLIDSSQFILDHSLNQNHLHQLLVSYMVDSNEKYVSIVDDDSFPLHRFSYTVKQSSLATMLDSSHGLVCLNVVTGDRKNRMNEIIVWNPSIKKSVRIQSPGIFDALRFGVCPKTGDPKILKITHTFLHGDWNAEVFRLSSMSWKSVPINMPRGPIDFSYDQQVVVDGVIYWIGYVDSVGCNQIITFDLTTEEFGKIELLGNLTGSILDIYISKIKECVVVLNHYDPDLGEDDCDVWLMMKSDVSKFSFTKIFTVDGCFDHICGFRNNGQPIIDRRDDLSDSDTDVETEPKVYESSRDIDMNTELKVYESSSKSYSGLGIYGTEFNINSYTESLLLLNHPNSISE